MKNFTFIAAIAISLLLTSCSADDENTTYTKPEQTKNFDSFNSFAKEADSISTTAPTGDPLKPKGKD